MKRTEFWPVGTRVVMVDPCKGTDGRSALGWSGTVVGALEAGTLVRVGNALVQLPIGCNKVAFDNGLRSGCASWQLRPIEDPDRPTQAEHDPEALPAGGLHA